jgi:cytochrome c biogenesis protein CcdA
MIDAPLAFAFSAGLVAAVNPCGFAMLPAYLSFFVSQEDGSDAAGAVSRALVTTMSLAAGFVGVFLVVGIALDRGFSVLGDVLPWAVIAIGVVMIGFGFALITGRDLIVRLPRLQQGGTDRSVRSMVLFGASYATASLGCTLPLFLPAVVVGPEGLLGGIASVFVYSLGMTLTIGALTVSLALGQATLVSRLRRLLPHVERIAGVFLVITGIYTVWFWVSDLRGGEQPGIFTWVQQRSADIEGWVSDTGAIRVGLLLAVIVASAILVSLILSERSRSRSKT